MSARATRDELERMQRACRELEAELSVEHSAAFVAEQASLHAALDARRHDVATLSVDVERETGARDEVAGRVRALSLRRRDDEQRQLPLAVAFAVPLVMVALSRVFQGPVSLGALLFSCGAGLGLLLGLRARGGEAASWNGRAILPLLGALAALGGAGVVLVEWARLGFAPDEQLVGWSTAAEHVWLSLLVHACATIAVTNAFGQPTRQPVLVTSAVALVATLASWAQWLPPRHAAMAPELLEAYPWVDTLASRWCLPLGSMLAPVALATWWLAARDRGSRRWVFAPISLLSGVAFFARVAMGEHSFTTVSFVPPATLALAGEALVFALMLGVLATRAPQASPLLRWLFVAAVLAGPVLFWLPG